MNYFLKGLDKTQEEKLGIGELLPIMEEFYTIQGEGYHSGKAAYFIRIGGCDVGCHWCDVKESWDASIHPLKSIDAVISNAEKHPARAVVITGGEPLIYNLNLLTKKLKESHFSTYIETSGAYPLTGIWDWICLSPKKTMLPKEEILPLANELKVIVHNNSDFEFAESFSNKVSKDCKLFLQPEWSKREKMSDKIVEYVMNNPKWMISLQTHKYLQIP